MPTTTVRVWDAKTGAQIAQLEGHPGTVEGAAFLPDGTLLTGAGDCLRRWDVPTEKVIWKSYDAGLGVFRMTVSGDGKRAAYIGRDGRTYVWELEGQRRRLATAGGSKRMHGDVALNGDGSELYGKNGEEAGFTRWEVATGNPLPKPAEMNHVGFLVFFPDGRRVVSYEATLLVRDMKTPGPAIGLQPDVSALVNCAAVSPDGKTVIAGAGGFVDLDGDRPGDHNWIAVYTIPDPGAAVATGPVAGKMSWEELPARVKTLDGSDVAFADWRPPNEYAIRDRQGKERGDVFGDVTKWPEPDMLRARGLTAGLDVLWTRHAVLFHDGRGALREVLRQEEAGYWDAVWDGKNVCIGSTHEGLLVLDRAGKLLRKIGAAEGMPPTEARIILYPLGPGRVLAAGMDWQRAAPGKQSLNSVPDSGWCGLVEWDGAKASVTVFFREPQIASVWRGPGDLGPKGPDKQLPFAPVWMIEGPPPAGWARSIWVGTSTGSSSAQPILRVDPATLRWQSYNLSDPKARGGMPPMNVNRDAPYWAGGAEVLARLGANLYRVPADEAATNTSKRKLLAAVDPKSAAGMLVSGGQVYVAGPRWTRADPKTGEAEDLGPGLRIDGKLAGYEMIYFASGETGLAAMPERGGRLFRMSADARAPLAVRATADLPEAGRAVPAGGVVHRSGRTISFYRGRGAIRFDGDAPVEKARAIEFPWANRRAELTQAAERIRWRCGTIDDERERAGITVEQEKALRAIKRSAVPYDAAAYRRLFAAYQAASGPESEQAAAAPLLAAAATLGEAEAKADESFVAQVKAVFSPRQWKLVNYQIPTAADDATIPAALAAPRPTDAAAPRSGALPPGVRDIRDAPPPTVVAVGEAEVDKPVVWHKYLGVAAGLALVGVGVVVGIRRRRMAIAATPFSRDPKGSAARRNATSKRPINRRGP